MTELSPRQEEVIQLMKEGKSTKEIAELLEISTRTVEMHRAKAMAKSGVPSHQKLVKEKLKELLE